MVGSMNLSGGVVRAPDASLEDHALMASPQGLRIKYNHIV